MTLLANSIPFCNRRSSWRSRSRDSARRCDLTPADFLQKRRVRGLRHFAAIGEQAILPFGFHIRSGHRPLRGAWRDNGPHAKATKFKGFQRDLDMVPLGPLKTVPAPPEATDHYRTIVDRYDKTVYRNMIVGALRAWPRTIVTSTTLRRINGSSTRIGTRRLVIAPRITACWGGASAASPSIRQKTTRLSRAFREH